MKGRITAADLMGLLMGAMCTEPARAQASSGSQDIEVFIGEMFGDRLTERPLLGSHPRLDDTATFGGRYTFHFNDSWGVQLSASYSPSRAGHAPNGTDDLGLTTVDLDAEWDIVPGFRFVGRPFVPYTVLGVGYAWASLDRTLFGTGGGRSATITDSDGFTGNIGLGAKYYLRDNLFIDFGARYRYLSRLVSGYGQGLNTAQTTLSLGYRF
jgi:opacity protein-like surface antigen